jgi:murein DD-endopeptidase MepM/ murein hydrolase activator NlpD
MAAPNVGITPEPQQYGRVVYLPLSAGSAQGAGNAQLSLTVSIENNHGDDLRLNKVTLTFADPSAPTESIAADLRIGEGATQLWFHEAGDNVLLDFPAPTEVTIWLRFDGFTDQASETFPLAAFVSPLPGGAYRFPSDLAALERGEYWDGRGAAHGASVAGVQLFGYDMGVVRYDEETGWTRLVPGGSLGNNEDYLVWGKPIVAMADGFVQSWLDGEPTNPNPPEDVWSEPASGNGNHFYIQHGDALVLYAHMQPGTLNPDLVEDGATVTRGAQLGLAGNSGSSDGPHLHIHATRGTLPNQGPPWPIPFSGIRATNRALFAPPHPSVQWDVVSREGLPSAQSAIRSDYTPGRAPRRERIPDLVDPMSLVLSGYIYAKINSPNPPPIEVVAARAARLADEAESWRRAGLPDLPPALARQVDALARELSGP